MTVSSRPKEMLKDKRIAQTLEVYDKIAKDYADYTFEKGIPQFQLMEFTSYLQKKARILDVGSGSGRDVAYLMDEGHDTIGIDFSKNIIKEAKKRVKDGKFKHMDMAKMSFKDSSFHGIWCHASLCHVLKADAGKVLQEFRRLLRPKGIAYIGLREGKGEKMVKYLTSGNLPKFFAFYTQVELESLVKNNSFKILKSYADRDEQSAWLNVLVQKE